MEINEKPIEEFVEKHKMDERDYYMQARVMEEEAREVKVALLQYDGRAVREEAADVIIATMVLAEIGGWLDELPELVAEKMRENLEKPVGRNPGEKVRKA